MEQLTKLRKMKSEHATAPLSPAYQPDDENDADLFEELNALLGKVTKSDCFSCQTYIHKT